MTSKSANPQRTRRVTVDPQGVIDDEIPKSEALSLSDCQWEMITDVIENGPESGRNIGEVGDDDGIEFEEILWYGGVNYLRVDGDVNRLVWTQSSEEKRALMGPGVPESNPGPSMCVQGAFMQQPTIRPTVLPLFEGYESMNGRRRTEFPRDSRTPVLPGTLVGLTAVFGMGTGVNPTAVAALTLTCGVEPPSIIERR